MSNEEDIRNEVQVICRYCNRNLGGVVAGRFVRWDECQPECPDDRSWWQKFLDRLPIRWPLK